MYGLLVFLALIIGLTAVVLTKVIKYTLIGLIKITFRRYSRKQMALRQTKKAPCLFESHIISQYVPLEDYAFYDKPTYLSTERLDRLIDGKSDVKVGVIVNRSDEPVEDLDDDSAVDARQFMEDLNNSIEDTFNSLSLSNRS